MYGCESWTTEKVEHRRIDAFELWCWIILERPLDSREIKPVNPKGNQSWIFIGKIDTEAEAPILWPPDAKSWLTGKDPDAGKDWRQEEKGGNRGWHGWMASSAQWTWVWANSGRQRRTGKPGVLQSMGSQRIGQNLVTEQQHRESSQTRDWTCVPYIGRGILIHCMTREVLLPMHCMYTPQLVYPLICWWVLVVNNAAVNTVV